MLHTASIHLKPDVETEGEVGLARAELAALLGGARVREVQAPGGGTGARRSLVAEFTDLDASSRLHRLAYASSYTVDGVTPGTPQQAVLELATAHVSGNGTNGRTRRRDREYLSHGIHKYKAKFFPRFARALINICSPTGDRTVLDPFSGSGTTALEAGLMGMPSIANDIDPLSCRIGRAKVRFPMYPVRILDEVAGAVAEARADRDGSLLPIRRKAATGRFRIPDFLRSRMEPDLAATIEAEAGGLQREFAEVSKESKELAEIVLSHALATRLALRWMGTGDNRFALEVGSFDLASIAASHIRRLQRSHPDAIGYEVPESVALALRAGRVTTRSAKSLGLEDDSVGAVVTSPPYLPAASGRETYLRSRATGLIALDLLSEQQIHRLDATKVMGSVLRKSSAKEGPVPPSVVDLVSWMAPQRERTAKADPTLAYFEDLRDVGRELHRVLVRGGKVAMVVCTAHTFYEMVSRKVLRRFPLADVLSDFYTDPKYGIGFSAVEQIRLELPKADFAARPASRHEYSETAVVFTK